MRLGRIGIWRLHRHGTDAVAERSLGTHPYFTPPEHTRIARERVGRDAVVAPEVAVVVEPDVCLQPLGHGPAPLDDYQALAEVLL